MFAKMFTFVGRRGRGEFYIPAWADASFKMTQFYKIMKRVWFWSMVMFVTGSLMAQEGRIYGALKSPEGDPVEFANVVLYQAVDSSIVKVEPSDAEGKFAFADLKEGVYEVMASFLGMDNLKISKLSLQPGQALDLGTLTMQSGSIALDAATVKATRALIEIKPDRTVFNVQGTINSVGSDALSLLRKAPSVTVDNNDNISVLGRTGVLVYVDGKRLPLNGEELSNYLQNLPAEQIDRIDIISNPGAKYEAEGNAGILDIRLKRDKSLGANGTVTVTSGQGKYNRTNLSSNGNYRNKKFNFFGQLGIGQQKGFNTLDFISYQNGLYLEELNVLRNRGRFANLRLGADYYLDKNQTIGFLYSPGLHMGRQLGSNRITIADASSQSVVDSILVAQTVSKNTRHQNTYNLNYRYDSRKGRNFNVDLDYGHFTNDGRRSQPNAYLNATEDSVLSRVINNFETPTDIKIYTFKADYEQNLFGGAISLGTKFSKVVSDNTFLVFDELSGLQVRDDKRSNLFKYDENVYAAYVNYQRPLSKNWSASAGLRTEQTNATGDLQAFLPELQEPPVILDYLSWFPSAGLNYTPSPKHSFNLNYGKRINRPDYNVLNPFNNQLSQLSFEKGNPFLRPEIVNNIELGYTLGSRYNFKAGYSLTENQITRLIGPDDSDPRASFISWDNLATQKIWSTSVSIPVEILKFWNAYFNLSGSHIDNQADYGEGAVVDVQAFTYTIYQQHTFELPWKLKGEVSGYYSGPGVWGGVFVYESSWSLDLGLQRKFLNDRMNVRLGISDLFYESGWDGVSSFDGLESEGSGRYDTRRASISVSYLFGNQNVKSSKRKTGMEEEAGRINE